MTFIFDDLEEALKTAILEADDSRQNIDFEFEGYSIVIEPNDGVPDAKSRYLAEKARVEDEIKGQDASDRSGWI
ncbi:MAG: hypothetical protein WCP11_01295 [Candidatus Saccharibacteria bacterium]